MKKRTLPWFVLAVLTACMLAGCNGSSKPSRQLTLLAGSEIKDLEPYFKQIAKKTGIELQVEYTGTLEGAERLTGNNTFDLAWFSHAKYLSMLPGTRNTIHGQEKIMLSPVIMGVKESRARQWGWMDQEVRWSDIADKAAAGELRFAMTNPAASNSGFTALLGVAAAFRSSTSALTSEDVDKEKLVQFFTGQKLTSGSSGWLAEAYEKEERGLDGLINYESVLMSMNTSGKLSERLHLVYPKEGIVTADYPLILLNKDKRETYAALVDYLKSESFQKVIMEKTNRRPVIPQVRLSDAFAGRMLVELPFPADRETIDSLIFSYLDEVRPPSTPVFVLDVSGSMQNQRINNLRLALKNLTGQDTSLTGKFSRFRLREQIYMIPFNHSTFPVQHFSVENNAPTGESMGAIRTYVDNLDAEGGTAIYAALMKAYQLAGQEKKKAPDRFYSIVLLSDGKNEHASSYNDFEHFYMQLPPETRAIKTFTILFGNANHEEMNKVAELTGGRVFNAQQMSLATVFKKIRGYQ